MPGYGAARHDDAFAVELSPHLPDAVHLEVLLPYKARNY
jgi:hypothetical protein